MFFYTECSTGILQLYNTLHFKIAVILAQMAPGNEVPTESVIYESNRLYFPDTRFFFTARILQLYPAFIGNGRLQNRKVFGIVVEALGQLQPDIIGQSLYSVFLSGTQHCFYFIQSSGIMIPDRFIGKTMYQYFGQQQGIGFFITECYRRQKIPLHHKISPLRFKTDRNTRFAQRFDVAVNGTDTDIEFVRDLFCRHIFARLQKGKYAEESVDAIHLPHEGT